MELTFLKKPSTEKITVVQWTGLNKKEVTDFCNEAALVKVNSEKGEYFGFSIPTFIGSVFAKPGDFIIKLKNNCNNTEVFEVWSEEKLNKSYINADDINRAYLEIEKETISEKLNKLNAFITDPYKKAPYKALDSIEQGFILSEKHILESYLRTLLTYAAYKYKDKNPTIKLYDRSKLEHIINLDSGNKYIIKVTRYPGKSIAELSISEQDTQIPLAKATRYDATLKKLITDLGDYLDLADNWYTLFGITNEYLDKNVQDETIETVIKDEFSYKK